MKEYMMKEIWRPVRGYEEFAEISNLGQIHYYAGKSTKYPDERFTYGHENKVTGYLEARIGGVKKGVHQWVYLTFVGDIPEGLQVNHIDENKHNNYVWNLNLMTPKDNCNWGTRNTRIAAALKGQKLSDETKKKIADTLRGKPNPKTAAALRGRKLSEETKTKMSAAQKNNTKKSRAVQALKDGNVVYEFPSTAEAYRQGFSQSAVSACCRNCYIRSGNNIYKGYIWRFAL